MGRKTNPKILRISTITRAWESKWFSDRRTQFRQQLGQDLKIRTYFAKHLRHASISAIEIARDQKETVLTVHTSRPAVVIGRGGSGIEQIQKALSRVVGPDTRIRINVQEIQNPDTDAHAVATQVVDQLERRMPYRRIIKQSVSRSMQAGAVGVRIQIAGRLNGADIARREWLTEGNVPLHTFRADISFAKVTAHTTYGTIGVKVWVNRGEIEAKGSKDKKPASTVQPQKKSTRRRSSLADKAKKPQPAKAAKK